MSSIAELLVSLDRELTATWFTRIVASETPQP
jgi:hypothetical protein